MKSKYGMVLIASLFVAFSVGCGGPSMYPVSGSIKYKGEPVADARVLFTPTGSGDAKPASGVTDAQGNFSLTTDKPGDGAMAGDYTVSVTKTAESKEGDYSAPPPPPFPEKYTNPTGSDLKASVKADGTNNFPLELTD